jgi:hypothetical protein
VSRALHQEISALDHRDAELAAGVVAMTALIQRLSRAVASHEAERLMADEARHIPA